MKNYDHLITPDADGSSLIVKRLRDDCEEKCEAAELMPPSGDVDDARRGAFQLEIVRNMQIRDKKVNFDVIKNELQIYELRGRT